MSAEMAKTFKQLAEKEEDVVVASIVNEEKSSVVDETDIKGSEELVEPDLSVTESSAEGEKFC